MKKKNVLLLGIFLLVAVTSGIVAVTYSRYLTEANGKSSAQIARWHILVNKEEVTQTKEFTIDDFTWEYKNTSGAVLENHIAPGVKGSTEIELDVTQTDVTLNYAISIDTTTLATTFGKYPQLVVRVGGEAVDLTTGSVIEGYTDVIDVTAENANKVVTVPIEIEWLNSEENNELDTEIGSTLETIEIPIKVTVSQVTE